MIQQLISKLEALHTELTELDASYLVGKIERPIYLEKRHKLRDKFVELKKGDKK